MPTPASPRRLAASLSMVLWVAILPVSAAAQAPRAFTHVTPLGDVATSRSPNTGRIHVLGELGFDTADFFRGAFDDVPQGLDEIVTGPDLAVAFELWRRERGWLRDLTLTVGTQNGIADQVQPADSLNRDWYESNNYAGLAATLPADWRVGLTYTAYTSPDDVSPTFQELALAVSHPAKVLGVSLEPQLKVAVPLERDPVAFQSGVYAELRVVPAFAAIPDLLTLRFPVVAGVGFDDYYGPGSGTSVFGSVGAFGAVPLKFVPASFGSWTFTAGVEVIAREDDIRRLSPFNGDDTVVAVGSVAIGFRY